MIDKVNFLFKIKGKCGKCRFWTYKLCSSNGCVPRTFCCLCCCSCCVPNTSSTRCFFWYCCCLGWKQTDPYKVFKTIKTGISKLLYCVFCCFLWKPLWKKTQEARDKKRDLAEKERKQHEKKKRKLEKEKHRIEVVLDPEIEDESDIDQEDDVDYDDYNLETQSFNKGQCPFPSTPFSTSNRFQSAAVYIIYTYDVLNIFMSLFTTTFTPVYIPYFGDVNLAGSGVLVNIVVQFLQVLIIGILLFFCIFVRVL